MQISRPLQSNKSEAGGVGARQSVEGRKSTGGFENHRFKEGRETRYTGTVSESKLEPHKQSVRRCCVFGRECDSQSEDIRAGRTQHPGLLSAGSKGNKA